MHTIGLLSKVYPTKATWDDLAIDLAEAASLNASLVILPELPLNKWSPSSREASNEDAEPWQGPRWKTQSEAAKKSKVALLGGIIVKDKFGTRRNTAVLFNKDGNYCGHFSKIHIPDEPGFRERNHYEPGNQLEGPFDVDNIKIGLQICSDLNRPSGSLILAARGAHLIACPRATELATAERWRPVVQAIALTSSCWVASVNRPSPEDGVLLGGPSWLATPDGKMLIESTEKIATAKVNFHNINQYKNDQYPGYLDLRSDIYANGWSSLPPKRLPYGIGKDTL